MCFNACVCVHIKVCAPIVPPTPPTSTIMQQCKRLEARWSLTKRAFNFKPPPQPPPALKHTHTPLPKHRAEACTLSRGVERADGGGSCRDQHHFLLHLLIQLFWSSSVALIAPLLAHSEEMSVSELILAPKYCTPVKFKMCSLVWHYFGLNWLFFIWKAPCSSFC